ncbi:hypothetical protein GO986_02505 [Deinococcus sp. HMF7620]|uniref:Uncharacterized protein n=1 Tax=Deinococcus arboris TaxID=2682977 RepID=A0A7C9HPU9_9DEIO|nr:hypothetical protein [Deinococcus arboris]MVN85629.1 hypothetical protein [Deinococcus arboris]
MTALLPPPVPAAPLETQAWLTVLNDTLPRQVFGPEASRDVQQLATICRSLLCLPAGLALPGDTRLQRVMGALLRHPLWEDLLLTNAEWLHPALPALHLWHRHWAALPGALRPVQRTLDAQLLTRAEWTPMHLLDLSVHLHALQADGLNLSRAALPVPADVAQTSALGTGAPTWLWCYEKVSVLNYLLRAARSGGLAVPTWSTGVTAANLIHALRGLQAPDTADREGALRAAADHALAHALSAAPSSPLLRRALQVAADTLAAWPDPQDRWLWPVVAANLGAAASQLEPLVPSGDPQDARRSL